MGCINGLINQTIDKCSLSTMSAEEKKIRKELEMEVEKDLETEIKDGIYQLALRLHHLYRQRNVERNNQAPGSKKKLCSELCMSVRLEGGTKIEFREIKRETPALRKSSASSVASKSGEFFARPKKFDWTQTLRSGSGDDCRGSAAISKKKKKAFIC